MADMNANPIKENNGQKEAVLYLHGCGSTPMYFEPFVNECVKCGYDVYGPVYRGHGTVVEDMLKVGAKEWEEDVVNTLESLLPLYEKIHIIGHSLGGALACYLAGLYADTGKIGKLMIMCPGFGLGNKDLYNLDFDKVGMQSFPFVKAPVYCLFMEKYAVGYDKMYFKTVKDLIENGEECLKQIPKITSPVWYMMSAVDPICDAKQQHEIISQFKNLADVHIFYKAGHNILNDCEWQEAHKRVVDWIHA